MNEILEASLENQEINFNQFFEDLEALVVDVSRKRKNLKPNDFTKEYKVIRRQLIEKFPKLGRMISVIFGLNGYIRSDENLNYHGESLVFEQKKKELINISTWQQNTTLVLVEMGWDQNNINKFWQSAKSFFDVFSHHKEDFDRYKSGIVGQARAFLILKELGYNPRLATPQEDVFEGTDFYISFPGQNEELRTQIKQNSLSGRSVVELVDCGHASIIVDGRSGTQTRIGSQYMEAMTHVREKCGDLSVKEGKQVKSLLIILSNDDFDQESGKPKQEFLDRIKVELESKIN